MQSDDEARRNANGPSTFLPFVQFSKEDIVGKLNQENRDSASEAVRALLLSPGYAAQRNLRELENTLQMFEGNTAELLDLLESEPPRGIGLRILGGKTATEKYMDEVDRRLYNFAMIRMTLVEHTRNTLDRLGLGEETAWYDEVYRPKKAAILKPAFKFLQDLRNYVGHSRPVKTNEVFTVEGDVIYRLQVAIHKNQLNYAKWSAGAKQYLNEPEPRIDVTNLVTDYKMAVAELYRWLIPAIRVQKADDFAEADRLRKFLVTTFEGTHRVKVRDPETMARLLDVELADAEPE